MRVDPVEMPGRLVLRRWGEPVARVGLMALIALGGESMAAGAAPNASPALPAGRSGGALEPIVVAVVLNATEVSSGELIYLDPASSTGAVWVRAGQLNEWRVTADGVATQRFEGVDYARLCGDATTGSGLACFYDESSAQVTLTARADRLSALRIGALQPPRTEPSERDAFGGYANYELFGLQGRARLLGLAVESHVFSGWGTGYLDAAALQFEGRLTSAIRLAGWQWDQPERGTSLAVGGVLTGGAGSLPPLPVLGLRYGTNSALRPEVVRVQRPFVSGTVERSSKADLFVDGLFRRSADVPYGPYAIEADALLAGRGQLQLVQTDVRGEKTVRNVDYYFAPQLLPVGMTDFDVEAGQVGRDPSRLSTQGDLVATASVRRGLSERHTASVAVVAGPRAYLLAGASELQWRGLGVVRSGVSVFDRGEGARLRAMWGHEYQSREFSAFWRIEATLHERAPDAPAADGTRARSSRVVRPIEALLPIDRRAWVGGVSWSASERLQVGATGYDQVGLWAERRRVLSAFLTWRWANNSQLTASVQQVRQQGTDKLVQLSWLLPLGGQHLATGSVGRARGRSVAAWSVQSLQTGLADERNAQYHVFGQVGPGALAGASYQRDESFGRWRTEVQAGGGETALRAGLSGSVGWMQHHAFATRRIDDSFIVVDTDGQAGVPVYFENRYAGVTGRDGKLLVPDARARQANQISIDASLLPIEYTLAQDVLRAVPGMRAGAGAHFEIGDGGIFIKAVDALGAPLPSGARAVVSSQSTEAVVGSRSEIFINRALRPARIEVTWAGGRCAFDYRPEGDAPQVGRALPRSDGTSACR